MIRPAVDGDRQGISAVHAASWLDSYRDYLSAQYLGSIHELLEAHWAQLELGEHDLLLLAEDDGEMLGFILAWDGEPFWINTLHVVPARRSSGAGAQLMAAASRQMQAQGRSSAWLDVIDSNTRAIAFYQRLGGVLGAVKEKQVGDRLVPNLRIDFPSLDPIIAAG